MTALYFQKRKNKLLPKTVLGEKDKAVVGVNKTQ